MKKMVETIRSACKYYRSDNVFILDLNKKKGKMYEYIEDVKELKILFEYTRQWKLAAQCSGLVKVRH